MEWYFQHDYELILKDESNTKMIESRSGTHQIPVLITPENWCIADSTPLLTLLDARMPQKRFYPDGLVGALTAVLEEYFDEWSARWCIHTLEYNGGKCTTCCNEHDGREEYLVNKQKQLHKMLSIGEDVLLKRLALVVMYKSGNVKMK